MKKLLGCFIVFFIAFLLLVVFALSYFGIIPGLSKIFGLGKPKDLGVKYDQADYQSARGKTNVKLESLPSDVTVEKSIIYSGSHPVDQSFSSEEFTSLANNRKYKYYPFSNVQAKFNEDGTMEASAVVGFENGINYLIGFGVTPSQINQALDKFKLPKVDFPAYTKVSGNIINNRVALNIEKLELFNIPVPSGIIRQYQPSMSRFLENHLKSINGLDITRTEIKNGKVEFSGSLPDVEMTVQK